MIEHRQLYVKNKITYYSSLKIVFDICSSTETLAQANVS